MSPGGTRILRTFWHMLPGSDLCFANPPQPLTTADDKLDDLHDDL